MMPYPQRNQDCRFGYNNWTDPFDELAADRFYAWLIRAPEEDTIGLYFDLLRAINYSARRGKVTLTNISTFDQGPLSSGCTAYIGHTEDLAVFESKLSFYEDLLLHDHYLALNVTFGETGVILGNNKIIALMSPYNRLLEPAFPILQAYGLPFNHELDLQAYDVARRVRHLDHATQIESLIRELNLSREDALHFFGGAVFSCSFLGTRVR